MKKIYIKEIQPYKKAATPPLILTITLDKDSHNYFTTLRNKYYPKHCNYLEAHLTFFHRLPSDVFSIEEIIQKLSGREILTLQVTNINNIGNGVVFTVFSDELQLLHKTFQQYLKPYLITKDRVVLKPHITIQNKVTAFKASETAAVLLANFNPFIIQGTGITAWHYIKGSWLLQQHYPFLSRAN